MKIGILGGTFDPIHQGHIYLARCALATFDLSRILIMVARRPPHKNRPQLTSSYHRFAMATLATAEMPDVMASSWELERDRPSYTIETLEGLSRQYPEDRYCFIAGGDSLKEVHLWLEYGRLLKEFNFVFVERVGIDTDLNQISLDSSLKKQFRIVCEDHKETLHPGTSYIVRAQPPAVSSTKIRAEISSGHYPDQDEVSGKVLKYIRKYQLYE